MTAAARRARGVWGCRNLCHIMRPANIHGSARRAGPAQNTHNGHVGGRLRATGGRVLLQCPVRPVGVVVIAPNTKVEKCQLRLLSASRTPHTTPRETASPTIGPPFKPRSTRLKRPAEPRFSFRSGPTSFLATAGILTRF